MKRKYSDVFKGDYIAAKRDGKTRFFVVTDDINSNNGFFLAREYLGMQSIFCPRCKTTVNVEKLGTMFWFNVNDVVVTERAMCKECKDSKGSCETCIYKPDGE